MTPWTFCQKCTFQTFWRFTAMIWAKLVPINSKMHLQHDNMPFLSLASQFTTFLLRHAHNQNFKFMDEEVTYIFNLFIFCNFFCLVSFPSFFLSLCGSDWPSSPGVCFQFKNFWERITEMGNFNHGVAQCRSQDILLQVFCSNL